MLLNIEQTVVVEVNNKIQNLLVTSSIYFMLFVPSFVEYRLSTQSRYIYPSLFLIKVCFNFLLVTFNAVQMISSQQRQVQRQI